MSQGVTEIQHLAKSFFGGIALDHRPLNEKRALDDHIENRIKITCRLDQLEKRSVRGRRHLDGFGKPRVKLTRIKGPKKLGVDQNALWLIKRAHNVLHVFKINGNLAANGGIHLRKKGRGNIVKINAPHIACRREARKISHNAAANGNHTVASGKGMVEHGL